MTQAPTPGPLDDASTRLLRSGDWIRFKNDPPVQVSSNDVTCGSPHWSFIGRPDADGWMPWSGGENPVPGRRVEVKIRWRNGVPSEWPVESDVMRWKHRRGLDEGGDIIAFRLAPTAPVEASGSEREHGPKCWGKTSISDEMMYCYCGSTDSPPGETREALDRLKMAVHVCEDDEMAADCATLEALLSARPLASGGQKGDSETLRVLLDNLVIAQTLSKDIRQKATDEARSYLYDLRHTPQPSGETREAVARLEHDLNTRNLYRDEDGHFVLKVREDDLRALLSALSTTPARAEAQDEWAAGEFVEPYAWIWRDMTRLGLGFTRDPSVVSIKREQGCEIQPLYAHPSPTPAADAERVRIAADALRMARTGYCVLSTMTKTKGLLRGHETALEHIKTIDEALAALKSTAAKEGGA